MNDDVLEAAEKAGFTKNEDGWSVTREQADKFYEIAFEAGRRLEAAQWLVDAED
jgi:hypothetical protein